MTVIEFSVYHNNGMCLSRHYLTMHSNSICMIMDYENNSNFIGCLHPANLLRVCGLIFLFFSFFFLFTSYANYKD